MLFALCSFAEAQQPRKIPRIGLSATGFRLSVLRRGISCKDCAILATSKDKNIVI